MVLGVGLISALLISKRRLNMKTRLQKLGEKLNKKRNKKCVMYEIPIMRILSILFIICVIFFYHWFQHEYFHEYVSLQSTNSFVFNFTENEKIGKVMNLVKNFFLTLIFLLLADLRCKIVKVQDKIIYIREFSRQKFNELKIIDLQEKEHLIGNHWQINIIKEGKQKFTQSTAYYAIYVLNQKQMRKELILKRAGIFHARKTVLQIANVINLQPDLRIY